MGSELYLDLDTFMHRLDPRTKMLLFGLVFICMLQFSDPLWLAPVFLLILVQLSVSQAWRNLGRIRHVLIVLSVSSIVIWNLFANGRTPLFLFVEVESLQYSISRTLLILSAILMGMVMISSTRNEELVLGMIRLGLPYRVGFAISTALRLVPTIAASADTIGQAQRSRGLDLDSGNMLARLRKYVPLLIPVFISTIRYANVLGMALESKGFGARANRTFYLQLQMKPADYALLAFFSALAAASVGLHFLGYGQISGLIQF
jgi:energy-coupling factor transport system permease protein